MAESNGPSPDVAKSKLIWKMVNDPKFAESKKSPGSSRQIYQRNSLGRAGVPMIPEDLLAGSSPDMNTSKMYKKLSINPLVPIGMGATVACLIGMCRATLNRNTMLAQYYMRGRCAAQFATVCFLVGGAMYFGRDPRGYASPGEIPKQPQGLTKLMLNQN